MNQILTILLRNVRSSSNRLSVVVKEVKQGNRFSQPWPPPLMLPGRLDPGKDEEWWQESVLISFWSRSPSAMKSICTTTMRGERGGSESFLAVMANSVGSLTTTPKQTICHSPMFEWYTICMWTKHACHGAAAVAVDNGDYFRPPYNLRVER